MTRGLRNCNPLNIRRVAGTEWKGQRAEQTDRHFVQFERIEWGLRAAFCILRTYARRYNAVCICDIIATSASGQASADCNASQRATGPDSSRQWPGRNAASCSKTQQS